MLKICLANYALGLAPALAIEAARRAIPGSAQPTFEEVEGAMRGGKKQ
jgi:chemotaxis protein MotA